MSGDVLFFRGAALMMLCSAVLLVFFVSSFALTAIRNRAMEQQWRESKRTREEVIKQLKMGWTPEQVSRGLNVPLVIVKHEKELL